jgi:hypothetical protein
MTGFSPAGAAGDGGHTGDKPFCASTFDQSPRGLESRNASAGTRFVNIFDASEKRGYRVQSHAGTVAAFYSAIHIGCLYPGNHASQTCSSGSCLVIGVFVRSEWSATIAVFKWRCDVRKSCSKNNTDPKGHKKGHENVPFWDLDGFVETSASH